MLTIKEFQELLSFQTLTITKHGKQRLQEREIRVDDVMTAIKNGEIIKQYEDDKPLPSCLVLGKDKKGQSIHLVLSHDEVFIYLITAYYPDVKIWSADFRKRKERT